MPPEEDDFMFQYQQQNPDLSFGSEYDPSVLDNFSSFLSPTSEPGIGPALESTQFDTSIGFGDQVSSQISKQKGLLETQNELSLDKIKKLQERAANPNYELSPTEAFATSALAILPTIFGYAIGGAGVGAQAAKVGSEGAASLIKNHMDSDTQQREGALRLAQTEQQRYQMNNQRANTLSDRQFQVDQQNANREDTQAFQQNLYGARKEAADAARGQLTQKQLADLERRKSQLNLQGYTYRGKSLPIEGEIPAVRKQQEDTARLQTLYSYIAESGADPLTTFKGQDSATLAGVASMLFNAQRLATGSGAALSKGEESLIRATLPGIAANDIPGALAAAAKGQDPREFAKTMMSLTQKVQDYSFLRRFGATRNDVGSDYYPPELLKIADIEPWDVAPVPTGTGKVTPELMARVGTVESNLNPDAVGPKTRFGQAQGAFQVLEPTGRQVHKRLGIKEPYDPFNPFQQLKISEAYMQELLDRNGGDEKKALEDYNAGMGTMGKVRAGDIPLPRETAAYTKKVLGAPPSRAALETLRAWKAGQNG